jgi:predicted DCC family thiol-disulfide oxidoreductase YuxK
MTEVIVLYDSDCGFCRWSLAKLLAWDRRRDLRPVPIQSPEADELLGEMAEEQRLASWHLVAGGKVRSAGDAFEPLLRRLPGGGPLGAVSARFPGAVDRAYRLVAGRRSSLGTLVTSGAKRRADRRIASRAASPRPAAPRSR